MALLSNINNLFSVDSTGAIEFSEEAGTAGYVLVSAGAGGPPVWTDGYGGNVTGSGTGQKVVKWTGTGANKETVGDGPITFATNDSTFAGTITASKNQNATSSFTFQNTDTTGTSVRTHLNATAGNRSLRLEAIHSDYSYVVSNNARMYFQTNSGSNNTLFLDGDNATFAGKVTTDKIFVAKGQNLAHVASSIIISQESTTKSQIRFYGADTSTAGFLEFTG